jgi:hypothetical protein
VIRVEVVGRSPGRKLRFSLPLLVAGLVHGRRLEGLQGSGYFGLVVRGVSLALCVACGNG